jgi:DNA (cytosine-5)-methyltransferase 1
MKILNLYACLGGNRYKWDEVADIEVTAVELDPELARLYQERFPNDKLIIADAHQYLLDHYKEFDFIWSSPPCPTHSRLVNTNKNRSGYKVRYPNMSLYQEVILLDNFFKGKYIVENVIPYYQPLMPAKKRGRHLYWTNFNLPNDIGERKDVDGIIGQKGSQNVYVKTLSKFHDYDFFKYKGKQRIAQVAANLVDYEAGKTILETALGIINRENINQTTMF